MSNVEEKIAATIANRARHRPAMERIRAACEALAGGVDNVRRLAEDLMREANRHSARPEYAVIGKDLAEFLSGPRSLDTLSARMEASRAQLTAVHARVHRETVNIGVLGRTKAGKSTILRAITGQDDNVIPSSSDFPTTAARTRIHHSPDRREAVVTLRDWETFRDDYLAPLHAGAGLGPAPATMDEFAAGGYRKSVDLQAGSHGPSDKVSAQPFLDKLNQAHRSFGEYRDLLVRQPRSMTVPLTRLRPYVAYPLDRGDAGRSYHAVRDVHIYCPFRSVDRARLVLVDLPGAGEAGLEIDRHFLSDLNNDVDLLLCVKKPGKDTVDHGAADFDILQLGQNAGRDVPLRDFLIMVVNRDRDLGEESFHNALSAVESVTRPQSISVRVCEATDETSVQNEVLLPVLEHLAERLGEMDAAAIRGARQGLTALADEVRDVLTGLGRKVAEWRRALPEEEDELRRRSAELRHELNLALLHLHEKYLEEVRAEQPIAEIEAAIEEADRRVRDWAARGFGRGDQDEWELKTRAAMAAEPFREYERQFNAARHEITRRFQTIDASLHAAVDRLWESVAAILRQRLTGELVPEGDRALPRLLASVEPLNVPIFTQALERLVELKKDYGSLFLRVAVPIIVKVGYENWQSLPAAHRSGPVPRTGPPSANGAGTSAETAAGATGERRERAGGDDEWWLDYEESPRWAPAPATSQASSSTTRQAVPEHTQPAQAQAQTPPPRSGGDARPAGLPQTDPDGHARNLHSILSRAVDEAVRELGASLRRESLSIIDVLASTVWVFTDGVGRTPDGEFEYMKICRPHRTTIWPEVFGGATAVLSGKIRSFDDGVHGLADSLAALDQALSAPLAG